MHTHLTPVALEFLLHCYYCPQPYPNPSPAQKDAAIWFERNGVIKKTVGEIYDCTEKGRAWVEDILKTPMPVQKWVSDRASNGT